MSEEFERQLQSSHELDDPLAVYVSYYEHLKTKHNFPSMSDSPTASSSGIPTKRSFPGNDNTPVEISSLLKRATSAFVKDRRYRNDPRYLKLWVAYAQCSRNAEKIYQFLALESIATDVAAYYENYAYYLADELQQTEKALSILDAGIQRDAQPKERLLRAKDLLIKRQGQHRPKELAKYQLPIEAVGDNEVQFEELRAKAWKKPDIILQSRRPLSSTNIATENATSAAAFGNISNTNDEDEDDDTFDITCPVVDPDDLTRVSIYRDNTADLRNLAQSLANKPSSSSSSAPNHHPSTTEHQSIVMVSLNTAHDFIDLGISSPIQATAPPASLVTAIQNESQSAVDLNSADNDTTGFDLDSAITACRSSAKITVEETADNESTLEILQSDAIIPNQSLEMVLLGVDDLWTNSIETTSSITSSSHDFSLALPTSINTTSNSNSHNASSRTSTISAVTIGDRKFFLEEFKTKSIKSRFFKVVDLSDTGASLVRNNDDEDEDEEGQEMALKVVQTDSDPSFLVREEIWIQRLSSISAKFLCSSSTSNNAFCVFHSPNSTETTSSILCAARLLPFMSYGNLEDSAPFIETPVALTIMYDLISFVLLLSKSPMHVVHGALSPKHVMLALGSQLPVMKAIPSNGKADFVSWAEQRRRPSIAIISTGHAVSLKDLSIKLLGPQHVDPDSIAFQLDDAAWSIYQKQLSTTTTNSSEQSCPRDLQKIDLFGLSLCFQSLSSVLSDAQSILTMINDGRLLQAKEECVRLLEVGGYCGADTHRSIKASTLGTLKSFFTRLEIRLLEHIHDG